MAESETPRVRPVTRDEARAFVPPRLTRLRWVGWLLDRSIPVGRYRIGLDPLLGLLPGVGDTITAAISVVIIYDAARLGLPVHVLARMLGNVLIDAIVGAVPVLGDLFDFAWQANTRNLRLVERHYDPTRVERPASRIRHALGVLAIVVMLGFVALGFFVLRALWVLISQASLN